MLPTAHTSRHAAIQCVCLRGTGRKPSVSSRTRNRLSLSSNILVSSLNVSNAGPARWLSETRSRHCGTKHHSLREWHSTQTQRVHLEINQANLNDSKESRNLSPHFMFHLGTDCIFYFHREAWRCTLCPPCWCPPRRSTPPWTPLSPHRPS
jgi:hypothetical protein